MEEMPVTRPSEKHAYFKWPVIRGLGVLGQSMMLGMKALQFSANAALDDGSEKEAKPVSKWMMTAQAIFSVRICGSNQSSHQWRPRSRCDGDVIPPRDFGHAQRVGQGEIERYVAGDWRDGLDFQLR